MKTTKEADLLKDTVVPSASQSLTTDHGVFASNTDDWLKVASSGGTGPFLLEDQIAREKIHRFDHERIPERVVHARGTAAHGYFKLYNDNAAKYTYAPVLTDTSRTTPVFLRFSTVQGSKGSADTVRDVRGFAVKFYTAEGNWDIVGNDIPVFFIQDAIKFPDFVHAVKPEPHNEIPQGQSAHNNFWDFVGLQPESAHMVMWAMSDRGIPRSYRMMQGFGVNTYTLINASGDRHFVKFHFIPELGVHSLIWDEALKLSGQDPDFHRRDLQEAIDNGHPPKWKFAIQTIPDAKEHDFDFDILDPTKIWPEELVPLEELGELVLNRNVDEFFAETEQAAFCTSHIVPGIGFSDDPLLQARNFSYFDTQISRLGINWEQIPINRPVCPVMNHHRGGQHQNRIVKSTVNYWPNRFDLTGPVDANKGGYLEFPQKFNGMKHRIRGSKFNEHFKQAQLFYHSLTPYEQAHLISAITFELSHCDDLAVSETYFNILNQIDGDLTKEVAKNLGETMPKDSAAANDGKTSSALSQTFYAPKDPTIATRRIAILVSDGFDGEEVNSVRTALSNAGAFVFIIGTRRGKIDPEGSGESVIADFPLDGQRSTAFDALFIPSGKRSTETLGSIGRAVHWLREAFGHCKAIGAIGEGALLVKRVLEVTELDFSESNAVSVSFGVVSTATYEEKSQFTSKFALEISKHRCYQRELDGLTARVAF
ncbi:catalase-like domain-containing protein [Mycena floridula]|nr:catalase-like domain-containing protein [Mycena floridula]